MQTCNKKWPNENMEFFQKCQTNFRTNQKVNLRKCQNIDRVMTFGIDRIFQRLLVILVSVQGLKIPNYIEKIDKII